MLRERAAENAALVEKAYGGADEDEEDEDEDVWTGVSHANQFEDEEHLATVTVVEHFDHPDSLIHGPPKPTFDPSLLRRIPTPKPKPKLTSAPAPPAKSKPNKVRYQTVKARKAERSKQRARRVEKAERAQSRRKRQRRC